MRPGVRSADISDFLLADCVGEAVLMYTHLERPESGCVRDIHDIPVIMVQFVFNLRQLGIIFPL